MFEMRSGQREDAVSRTSFAAFAAAGVQSARLLNPKTIATAVSDERDAARERNAVQPHSVAGFRSRNCVVPLQQGAVELV